MGFLFGSFWSDTLSRLGAHKIDTRPIYIFLPVPAAAVLNAAVPVIVRLLVCLRTEVWSEDGCYVVEWLPA
jgi:hypothetical protein